MFLHVMVFQKISTRSYKASDENTFGKKDTDMLVDLFEANTLDVILSFNIQQG